MPWLDERCGRGGVFGKKRSLTVVYNKIEGRWGKKIYLLFMAFSALWRPKVNEGRHRNCPESLVNATNFELGEKESVRTVSPSGQCVDATANACCVWKEVGFPPTADKPLGCGCCFLNCACHEGCKVGCFKSLEEVSGTMLWRRRRHSYWCTHHLDIYL